MAINAGKVEEMMAGLKLDEMSLTSQTTAETAIGLTLQTNSENVISSPEQAEAAEPFTKMSNENPLDTSDLSTVEDYEYELNRFITQVTKRLNKPFNQYSWFETVARNCPQIQSGLFEPADAYYFCAALKERFEEPNNPNSLVFYLTKSEIWKKHYRVIATFERFREDSPYYEPLANTNLSGNYGQKLVDPSFFNPILKLTARLATNVDPISVMGLKPNTIAEVEVAILQIINLVKTQIKDKRGQCEWSVVGGKEHAQVKSSLLSLEDANRLKSAMSATFVEHPDHERSIVFMIQESRQAPGMYRVIATLQCYLSPEERKAVEVDMPPSPRAPGM